MELGRSEQRGADSRALTGRNCGYHIRFPPSRVQEGERLCRAEKWEAQGTDCVKAADGINVDIGPDCNGEGSVSVRSVDMKHIPALSFSDCIWVIGSLSFSNPQQYI